MLSKSIESDRNPDITEDGTPAQDYTGNFTKNRRRKNRLGILCMTTYPPRECGIATFTHDLVHSLRNSFGSSFDVNICALASKTERHLYPKEVTHVLETDDGSSYQKLIRDINDNPAIDLVLVEHEFGLFGSHGEDLAFLLKHINKPIIVAFHTVLHTPDTLLKKRVQQLSGSVQALIVMTKSSRDILVRDYVIEVEKILVIPHGTHLVTAADKPSLKRLYGLEGRIVLSTFGFLGSGKNIETTLAALPPIVSKYPHVMFLIIGKTHPSTILAEGETYRNFLTERIQHLELQEHVTFINVFLPLAELLDYLQLTDIYLFTSKDPNQAVSGTFSYAVSCGCPIISTPIPHSKEVLGDEIGVLIDFENSRQLTDAIEQLLNDHERREEISIRSFHKMASTAWQNSAISHALLFKKVAKKEVELTYVIPPIHLLHIQKMTTEFGMIQFSKISKPDLDSGYTLDDNARALVALCEHYQVYKKEEDISAISKYLNFVQYCQQPDGSFLNYVDQDRNFTTQNQEVNLEDSNGRAIWALGYVSSLKGVLPVSFTEEADNLIQASLPILHTFHSPRAMAFIIKGLYYQNLDNNKDLIKILADRLMKLYYQESNSQWLWFESVLTYGNSLLPEAMLCAFLQIGNYNYKVIALESFDFLMEKIFVGERIKVISNQGWHWKDSIQEHNQGGEQPIDIAYTIMALEKFYNTFKKEGFKIKANLAFDWFLGKNHLHQIVYNPCTGGCYDGVEKNSVNLNQGAESTISYLLARMSIERMNRGN